ncbi:copper homeostasis protein CutC [Paenibacillus sp. 1P07SE]|uniref:copper homeostasis protein CutC n=1 Tax=Paenibacillus sp. 1P07SE TaxID=3132209 RepID=UPI0039A60465
MLLEVIATTYEDAVIAERNGADRIELITAFTEGGLTPSIGTVAAVLEEVRIPVRVMVRPHARGFMYSADDIRIVRSDIEQIRSVGGREIVLGLLRSDRTIDLKGLEELLAAAKGMKATFHRAFDEVRDQHEALSLLMQYPQITDILTSGGQSTAPEGAARLRSLHAAASATGSIGILAGSGLSAANIADFMQQTGIRRLHVGTSVRRAGSPLTEIEPERLQAIRAIMKP